MTIRLMIAAVLFSAVAFASEPYGKVLEVMGVVESGTRVLKVGDPIFAGDMIKTSKGGSAKLLIDNDIAVKVGPETEFLVENKGTKKTSVTVYVGMLMSKVRSLVKDKVDYEVKTPNATMGVRGTTFFVKQMPKKPTFLCVCEGKVDLAWKKGKTQITTKHHDSPKWVFPTSAKLVPGGMGKDHNDQDAVALAKFLN
ncbi:MAG: FecR domain-containing protein [Bacteriovoracia bacterium]